MTKQFDAVSQTLEIRIVIPPRAEGETPQPSVLFTRSTVLRNPETGEVEHVLPPETRPMANPSAHPQFAAFHAVLAAAADATFAPPANPE
jgi:hypothetical protein